MRKLGFVILSLLVGAFLTACSGLSPQTAGAAGPQKILSKGMDFAVFSHLDRHYVTGSEESTGSFAKHGHLPYARTVLGAGPEGETVVFEINKKDPAYVERLVAVYQKTPFLVDSKGDNYAVYKLGGRLFVIGNAKTIASFVEHGHLPYTKTLLGAGPMGETVIFEVDKKNPAHAERLVKMFKG